MTMQDSTDLPRDTSRVDSLEDKSLLLVDDDQPFLNRLGRAMERRGFEVRTASSVGEGLAEVRRAAPAFAVVDLRLEDGTGRSRKTGCR